MKKVLIQLVITLMIFSLIVWSSKTTSTHSVVNVKEVSSNEIVVQDSNGENLSIKTPRIIEQLIFEDKDYVITYIQKRWGKPELKRIEPL